jgi:hypothetical protein
VSGDFARDDSSGDLIGCSDSRDLSSGDDALLKSCEALRPISLIE